MVDAERQRLTDAQRPGIPWRAEQVDDERLREEVMK